MIKSEFWQFSRFLRFAKRLLSAYWRSLLLLFAGVALPLLLFERLAIAWQTAGGFPWDEPLLLAIHATASPRLDRFAVVLTQFGVQRGVLPATIAITLGLLHFRRWRSLVYLLTVSLGTTVLNRTAKAYWHRTRPSLWESMAPEHSFSFPSGHAMSSMAFVVALLVLTWGTRWWLLVWLGGSWFVVGIGWTRLYLGVHFPSDILAGWMASIAWALGLSLLMRPHLTARLAATETALTPSEAESIAPK